MKGVVIANPKAGGGRAYRALSRHLRQWRHPDWDIEIHATDHPGHAGEIAQELTQHPPDLLAVCSGDGTLNEIASAVPAPPFPVAVLPGGTANVVARELKLPLNPVRAFEVALRQSYRTVDLGVLGPGARRRFVFVAGIGFDAYVAANVNPGVKDVLGVGAYIAAGFRCLRDYPFQRFQVAIDDRIFNATSCIVANGRRYGGGLVFCPQADMQNGLLDVLVIDQTNRLELVRFFFLAWLRRPQKHPWLHFEKARKLSILGPQDILIQTDGESAGTLPAEISIEPSTFPLIVP